MLQPSDMQTWLHCSDTNLDSEKALFQASIASIEKVDNRLAPIVSIWHLPSVSWWLLVVSILPAAGAGAPPMAPMAPMAGGKRGPASRVNKLLTVWWNSTRNWDKHDENHDEHPKMHKTAAPLHPAPQIFLPDSSSAVSIWKNMGFWEPA